MARKRKKYIGTVYQRAGRPGYYWRAQVDGKRIKKFLALDLKDAKAIAAELTSKVYRGEIGGPNRLKRIRFEEFVATHLKQLEREHAETTYHDEENRWLNVISPHFAGRWVDEIGTGDVEGFLLDAAKSPATRNRFSSLLSRFYKRAIQYEHATENPVKGVQRLKEEERDFEALSIPEQERILDAAHERIRDYILVSLDTGCRQGEVLRLTWQDVDLSRGTVAVRKTKAKQPRLLPLTARLQARLAAKKSARTIPLDGPDLVLSELEGKFSGHVGQLFRAAVTTAGFPDLRPHDLRHLCATNLTRAGVPLPDVARWLGHSPNSLRVTMRYSRHAPANASERARDLLDAQRREAVG